MKSFYICIC